MRFSKLCTSQLSLLLFWQLGVAPSHAQGLQAVASVTRSGLSEYNFTLTNNEPLTSGNQIDSFSLTLALPISDVQSPAGWVVATDNLTYLYWINNDAAPPFPNDIAPGAALSGFSFDSPGLPALSDYTIYSYDHANDISGPTAVGQIMAPAPVPEFSTASGFGLLLLVGFGVMLKTNRHTKRIS